MLLLGLNERTERDFHQLHMQLHIMNSKRTRTKSFAVVIVEVVTVAIAVVCRCRCHCLRCFNGHLDTVYTKYTGFIQKIATIFPGLFKDQIEFSKTPYQECNFTDGI